VTRTIVRVACAISLTVCGWLNAQTVAAETPAEFYKGKTVDLMIGYAVGGAYDIYGRTVARHIGKHIPGNPSVVAKNMDGAGGLRLANHFFQIAPQDGTQFGIIGRGVPFEPLFGVEQAKFDGTKFGWLGSANDEVSVCAVLASTGISSIKQVRTQEVVIAGTGASNETDQYPKVINGTTGTRFKVVSGYPTGNGPNLAIERGEVQGRCGWSYSSVKATHAHWLAEKKLNILVQVSLNKHPELPDVPLVAELAVSEEARQIQKLVFARQLLGRPFLAPPNLPADRLAALRKAFMDTMADKEFLAEADKSKLEITPVAGEEIERVVKEIYAAPRDIAAKAAGLMK
jgi:tripartite-type tricarboxylate transporter receptor subunit TctC